MTLSDDSFRNSLWWMTAREAPPATSRPDGDADASVLVIGGGFTGLAAALELARHGIDVVLAEARHIGFGASGRNGGQVIPGLKYDPEELVAKYGETGGNALVDLAGGAADLVFDLIDRHGIDCQPVRGGWIQAAHSEKALGAVQNRARQWQARGVAVEMLDRAAIAERIGTSVYHGGWRDPRAGSIQPLDYARGLARAAIASGARIFENTPVRRLSREDGFWLAETDFGAIRADKVVVATNGHTGGLVPGLSSTVLPVQSMQVATAPLSDKLVDTVLRKRVVVSETRKLAFYFRLSPDNRLMLGGRGAVGAHENEKLYAALEAGLRALFPQLRDVPIGCRWSGQVALTMDGLPHLHMSDDGLMVALGYNGRGIAMATALGTALGRNIGAGAPLVFPVTPIRPLFWHALRKPIVNIGVRWYWLKDRLGYAS